MEAAASGGGVMKWQGRQLQWPWEKRSSDYTQTLVRLLQTKAERAVDADPSRIAVLEIASGIWGRAMASAKVEPDRAAKIIPAWGLSMIGRSLIRRGECLFLISVANGKISLIPASAWNVTGGASPSSWRYDVELVGPSNTITKKVSADAVLHFRYAVDPDSPWKGCGPLDVAEATGELAANLEVSLGNEAGTPHGFLLPVPQGDDADLDSEDDPLAVMKSDLGQLAGGLSIVETTAAGWGEGRGAAPQRDWMPNRLGPNPPAALCGLREDVTRSVLSACGISPAMVGGRSDGTARREAWRQFLFGTLAPVANTIQEEFRAKLEIPELKFEFDTLRASDLTGRARAFQSLVGGGMAVEKAAALSGLLSEN